MKHMASIMVAAVSVALSVRASEPTDAIATAHVAVTNFLMDAQQAGAFPRPVFAQAEVTVSSNAVGVRAPGLLLSIGATPPAERPPHSQVWESTHPRLFLLVEHVHHDHVESIPTPPQFSPKPRAFDSVHIQKSPIVFKRPTDADINRLIASLAQQGINMKKQEPGAPNKPAGR